MVQSKQVKCCEGKAFEQLHFVQGQSAEQHLAKIRRAAWPIGYGEVQIANRFLLSLPTKCQNAVIMAAPGNATTEELIRRYQQ
jgi:hypothetical protein